MKNLITSLKKLGKKMTGDDVTGADLVTVVDNIADGYTGGGSGGGGGCLVARIVGTIEGEDENLSYVYTLDKTYAELLAAAQTGCVSCISYASDFEPSLDEMYVYPITGFRHEDGVYSVSIDGNHYETDSEFGYPEYSENGR